MEERNLNLQKYGISKERYLELKYFCRQYHEFLDKIQYGLIKSTINDGMPKGGINTSSPVEQQAIDNNQLIDAINLIDDTVNATVDDEKMRKCILQAVTLGTSYERMKVPCGRRQFYELRRKFFYLLAQKK